MKKKVLFVQLPIPRLTISREDHNIPVAAYYLYSYLQAQPIARHLEIQILNPDIQNYGSDEIILQEIRRITPDVLGFSLFCWNIERSLYLAEQFKHSSRRDHIPVILAGGPEVSKDNPLLHHAAIDLYVYGEGEYTLTAILEWWLAHGQIPVDLPGTMYCANLRAKFPSWEGLGVGQHAQTLVPQEPTPAPSQEGKELALFVNPPQRNAIDPNDTQSAYLQGLVPRKQVPQMFFETMRGCPFACHFCYYHKNCNTVRFLTQEIVLELLQYALDHQYDEIFLLDPSFNIRPDLEELLKKMAIINKDRRVKIATELRADMVTEHLAQLLSDAGICDVEIGLQSIHPDTIQRLGRTQHLDKFLRGACAMRERGIDTKVDLIVGLPGDNLEKFKESARWVKQTGLDEHIQLFCLSVLPGTYFREHAAELGLKFSPFPPYYLLSSPDWSSADIRQAFRWAEDFFDIALEADLETDFSLTPVLDERFREIIPVDPAQPFAYPALTTSITKWVIGPIQQPADLTMHLPTMQAYTRNNPYSIYHVYLDLWHEIPLEALFDFYTTFKSLRSQYIDRDFNVLNVAEVPIVHYQMAILIKIPVLSNFSESYLETLQQHFPVEILTENS